jgi:CRISPR-associated protein Cas1
VIRRDGEELGRVPLEDLGTLILAGPGLTVTTALLAALAEQGGVTIVAGRDQAPEGALLPLRANTTRGERARAQVAATRPLEKNLWACIVQAKLRNQAALLTDPAGHKRLSEWASSVRSGDPKNLEAQGARLYWKLVFQGLHPDLDREPFLRRRDGAWPNPLLNYGYAVLRAVTARALCAAGLLPELGVHHHSRYDPFPLASDLMEPYRPWVDLRCRELIPEGPRELDRPAKQALLQLYEDPVLLAGEQTPLAIAVERSASTLAKAFLTGRERESAPRAASLLLLPAFPESAG